MWKTTGWLSMLPLWHVWFLEPPIDLDIHVNVVKFNVGSVSIKNVCAGGADTTGGEVGNRQDVQAARNNSHETLALRMR
jgi:hypothetical protein